MACNVSPPGEESQVNLYRKKGFSGWWGGVGRMNTPGGRWAGSWRQGVGFRELAAGLSRPGCRGGGGAGTRILVGTEAAGRVYARVRMGAPSR